MARPPPARGRACDPAAARAGLCAPRTVVLVAFELRSSQVKRAFLAAAGAAFSHVERLPRAELPKDWQWQAEHIELYRLRL